MDLATLDEATAFAYLQHLKGSAVSPSRADSFLRVCNFAFGSWGFTQGPEIASSPRCIGSAAISMADRRVRKQRDPLQAPCLVWAEEEIVAASIAEGRISPEERVMLGFLTLCAHARARCSDAARVTVEPWLDESEGPGCEEASFVETYAVGAATKSGNTAKETK